MSVMHMNKCLPGDSERITLPPSRWLRDALAEHGLHIVSAADKAVLDALRAISDVVLEVNADSRSFYGPVIRAELARREAAQ